MESNTKEPFAFTTPYFYAGLMIAGNPSYVDCVEASEGNRVNCQGLRICTVDNSMHQDILLDILDGVTIVPNNDVEEEKWEHELVLGTLDGVEDGRWVWRLINGVLVEKTKAEVVPDLNQMIENIVKAIE